MRRIMTVFCLFATVSLFAGCQPSKENLAVKTSTDYSAEAAERMAEKSDFQYSEHGYKTSSKISYSFQYPENWSVPADMQYPEIDVVCLRHEPIDGFTPNFVVAVLPAAGSSAQLMKMTKSQFKKNLQEGMSNLEILAFEHGKFQERDVVYLHAQGTTEGIKVEQIQYLFIENGKEIALGFTASRPVSDAVKEEFDAILGTFKIGP